MVKVTWEYYKRRRNVNFEAFLKGRNIETYEQLCETLHKMGIMAPKKEEFEEARPKIEESKLDVVLEEPKAKVEPVTPKPKRKYTRRKKK